MSPEKKYDLTIAIPVFNGGNWLSWILRPVIQEIRRTPELKIEVLINDNASTDHTEQTARSHGSQNQDIEIVYNRQATNLGFGINYLDALERSKGNKILTLGDDILRCGALKRLTPYIKDGTTSFVHFDHTRIDHNTGQIINRSMLGPRGTRWSINPNHFFFEPIIPDIRDQYEPTFKFVGESATFISALLWDKQTFDAINQDPGLIKFKNSFIVQCYYQLRMAIEKPPVKLSGHQFVNYGVFAKVPASKAQVDAGVEFNSEVTKYALDLGYKEKAIYHLKLHQNPQTLFDVNKLTPMDKIGCLNRALLSTYWYYRHVIVG